MNTPYTQNAECAAEVEQRFPRIGLVHLIIMSPCELFFADHGVFRLGYAYDKHDLVVGANNVLNSLLGLGVDDTALLVVLLLGLMGVCLALALYNIIIRGAALIYN